MTNKLNPATAKNIVDDSRFIAPHKENGEIVGGRGMITDQKEELYPELKDWLADFAMSTFRSFQAKLEADTPAMFREDNRKKLAALLQEFAEHGFAFPSVYTNIPADFYHEDKLDNIMPPLQKLILAKIGFQPDLAHEELPNRPKEVTENQKLLSAEIKRQTGFEFTKEDASRKLAGSMATQLKQVVGSKISPNIIVTDIRAPIMVMLFCHDIANLRNINDQKQIRQILRLTQKAAYLFEKQANDLTTQGNTELATTYNSFTVALNQALENIPEEAIELIGGDEKKEEILIKQKNDLEAKYLCEGLKGKKLIEAIANLDSLGDATPLEVMKRLNFALAGFERDRKISLAIALRLFDKFGNYNGGDTTKNNLFDKLNRALDMDDVSEDDLETITANEAIMPLLQKLLPRTAGYLKEFMQITALIKDCLAMDDKKIETLAEDDEMLQKGGVLIDFSDYIAAMEFWSSDKFSIKEADQRFITPHTSSQAKRSTLLCQFIYERRDELKRQYEKDKLPIAIAESVSSNSFVVNLENVPYWYDLTNISDTVVFRGVGFANTDHTYSLEEAMKLLGNMEGDQNDVVIILIKPFLEVAKNLPRQITPQINDIKDFNQATGKGDDIVNVLTLVSYYPLGQSDGVMEDFENEFAASMQEYKSSLAGKLEGFVDDFMKKLKPRILETDYISELDEEVESFATQVQTGQENLEKMNVALEGKDFAQEVRDQYKQAKEGRENERKRTLINQAGTEKHIQGIIEDLEYLGKIVGIHLFGNIERFAGYEKKVVAEFTGMIAGYRAAGQARSTSTVSAPTAAMRLLQQPQLQQQAMMQLQSSMGQIFFEAGDNYELIEKILKAETFLGLHELAHLVMSQGQYQRLEEAVLYNIQIPKNLKQQKLIPEIAEECLTDKLAIDMAEGFCSSDPRLVSCSTENDQGKKTGRVQEIVANYTACLDLVANHALPLWVDASKGDNEKMVKILLQLIRHKATGFKIMEIADRYKLNKESLTSAVGQIGSKFAEVNRKGRGNIIPGKQFDQILKIFKSVGNTNLID